MTKHQASSTKQIPMTNADHRFAAVPVTNVRLELLGNSVLIIWICL